MTTNFILTSAKLNSKLTSTALPVTVGTLLPGETVTRSVRFAANTAVTEARVTLTGSGSENGGAFSGSISVTVP